VTATPATIEQLARDIVRSADPDVALRALSAMRQELDAIEPVLVGRAMQTGASWNQVARALGVSKQAAHRKHRHAAERIFNSEGIEPKILVTSEARRSVQLARQEAEVLGQPAVGTEHILLGVLRCKRSHAVRALNALGVTHERARAAVQTTMPGVTSTPPATRDGEDPLKGVTAHARRILEGSLREALKRGDGYIGVEHLLLALLTDSRNGAVQTLEALQATPSRVRRQLDREWTTITVTQQG
jgi:ATP-dependent Clp protease ATP-binding subunit ClpA